MKISPINYTNTSFKSRPNYDYLNPGDFEDKDEITGEFPKKPVQEFRIGYPDKLTQAKIDFTRDCRGYNWARHERTHSGRLSEFKLNKELSLWKPPVNNEKLQMNLSNCRELASNCYSGETLADKKYQLANLKQAGIERYIDIKGYSSMKEACEENKLGYFKFHLDAYMMNEPPFINKNEFLSEQKTAYEICGCSENVIKENCKYDEKHFNDQSQKFIKELKKFVTEVNKGYFYMACERGSYATDTAIVLNNHFNKKKHLESAQDSRPYSNYENIKNLYSNLTPEDKKFFGFTEEDDERYLSKNDDYY